MTLQVLLTPQGGIQTDITDFLTDGLFQVGRSLGGEGASCSFALVNYAGAVAMADVTATWNSDPIYRGQVLRRRRRSRGDVTFLAPECADAVIRIRRRLVAETYQETAASAMVLDLLAKYAPDITPDVSDIPVVLDLTFSYVPLLEAIKRIADAVGAYWYLGPDNTLRFFTTSYDLGTTPEYSPDNILADTLEDEMSAAEFANRVWVLGSKQASTGYKTQVFAGSSDVFQLAYQPNYTEVRVNGVSRSVKLKENADSSTEFVVDKKQKAVESRIALVGSDEVQIRYRPTVEIVDFFEDPSSIQTFGLYETVIRDRTITDKSAARERGRNALRRAVVQRPVVTWQSDVVWQVYPGQQCSLVYPQFGLDGTYRLTDVDVQFQFTGHRWHVVASLRAEGL